MAELAALGAMLTTAAPAISSAATIAGTVIGVGGALSAGKSAQQSAEHEAAQLDIQAKEERAAAQREAEQLRRRKQLALSSLTAGAAGSGFSATDPTALALAGDIETYGTVQEQMAQYGGESRARGREGQAAAARYEGKVAKQASRTKALGTIMGGVTTLADKYAPKRSPASNDYYDSPGGWRTTVRYG